MEGEGAGETDDVIMEPDSDLDKSPPKLRASRKVGKRRRKLKRRGDKKQVLNFKTFLYFSSLKLIFIFFVGVHKDHRSSAL